MAIARAFKVVLQKEKDGGYSVYAPELPGCISQGESKAEAMENIREAIELYLSDLSPVERAALKKDISIVSTKVTALA